MSFIVGPLGGSTGGGAGFVANDVIVGNKGTWSGSGLSGNTAGFKFYNTGTNTGEDGLFFIDDGSTADGVEVLANGVRVFGVRRNKADNENWMVLYSPNGFYPDAYNTSGTVPLGLSTAVWGPSHIKQIKTGRTGQLGRSLRITSSGYDTGYFGIGLNDDDLDEVYFNLYNGVNWLDLRFMASVVSTRWRMSIGPSVNGLNDTTNGADTELFGGTGNANNKDGGHVLINPGDGYGSGVAGKVVLKAGVAVKNFTEVISGHVVAPDAQTIVLDQSAAFAYDINTLITQLTAGTLTAALKINGTNVTSISSHSATTSEVTSTATAAYSVAVGDTVTLVLSSISSAANLSFSIKTTRT